MGYITAGITAAKDGVTSETQTKQSSTFRRYTAFLATSGINDPFLTNKTETQRQLIMSGFAHSIRTNYNGSTRKSELLSGTVQTAISHVVQTFRQNFRPDPTRDTSGAKGAILIRQLKSYKDADPATAHQACLPLQVWQQIYEDNSTPLRQAQGALLLGALFFAMRSCEYSTTNKDDGKRKTKIINCAGVRFFSNSSDGAIHELPHDRPLPSLAQADCVSITFVDQKNGEKMETITQHRVTNGSLCPVQAWATTIKRVESYTDTTLSSPVNTFLDPSTNKLVRITAKQMRSHIVSHVKQLGPEKFGIDIKRVGTHSLRSSCAMLLYLAEVRTSTIMLLGRWKSDAFLLYLRKQVKEFTKGVSNTMVDQPSIFSTIPNTSHHTTDLPNRHRSDRDDPMTSNVNSIASHARFNGPSQDRHTSNARNNTHSPVLRIWG